jgi:hypothetical protein
MVHSIGTYQIPAWALPALINGDTSDLSGSEESALEDFVYELSDIRIDEDKRISGLIFNPLGEAYFSNRNDVDGQGGDVIQVEISGNFVS